MSVGLTRSHARAFDDSPVAVTSSEVIRPKFDFSDFIDTDNGESIGSVVIIVYKAPRMEDVSTDIKSGSESISSDYVEQGFSGFNKDESYLVTVEVTVVRAGSTVYVKENYMVIHCLL